MEDLKKCSAIFLDEFAHGRIFKKSFSWLLSAEIYWIAVSAQSIGAYDELIREHVLKGNESVNLSLNLRNTKDIVDAAKRVAVKELSLEAISLSDAPSNFPNGPLPEMVESIEEAIERARKLTKKGILVTITTLRE